MGANAIPIGTKEAPFQGPGPIRPLPRYKVKEAMVRPKTKPHEEPLDRVEELLALCLDVEGSERQERVSELSARHPELAEALAERLAHLETALSALPTQRTFRRTLGDFELEERIGSGGMGAVFAARQISLGRRVAVKLVRPELAWLPGARERFRREVDAVARLRHRSIVPVHAAGEEDGIPFLAMELVDGATLAEVLAVLGDRSPESLRGSDLAEAVAVAREGTADTIPELWRGSWIDAVLDVTRQIASALAHAHGEGIVHRDVKPSNILLTSDGRAFLFDFGLTLAEGSERVTQTGARLGTPLYMSPEQVLGVPGAVGAATDIYSLGATLYEMLALQPAFRTEGEHGMQARILAGTPEPLRARNRSIAEDVETVVRVAMDRDQERRFSSAEEFERDLANLIARRAIEARAPGPLLRGRRFAQRHPALVTGIALSVALSVGLPTVAYVQELRNQHALRELLRSESDARAEAEFVSNLLINTVEEVAPRRSGGQPPSLRDVLDTARAELAQSGDTSPRALSRLLVTLAAVYEDLDAYEETVALANDGFEQAQSLDTEEGALLGLRAQRLRGKALHHLGRYAEAIADLEAVVATNSSESRMALLPLAHARLALEQREGALLMAAQAVDAFANDTPRAQATSRAGLGTILVELDEHARAEVELSAAVSALRELDEAPDPDLLEALSSLGLAIRMQERLDEAFPFYEEALQLANEIYGEDSAAATNLLLNLAGLNEARGELESAAEGFLEAAGRFEALFGDHHPGAVISRSNYAATLMSMGRLPEALAAHRLILPRQQEVFGPTAPMVAFTHARLGRLLVASGESEPGYHEMLRAGDIFALHPQHAADALIAYERVALYRRQTGDEEGAFELIYRGLDLEQHLEPDDPQLLRMQALADS